MTLKAIIFDVDGTLAETEKDGHRVAFNLAFEESGLPFRWDIDLYGKLLDIGGGKERLKYYLSHHSPSLGILESLDQFIVKLHQIKSRYYRQLLLNNSIPLRLGVKRLITEAKENDVRLAIASTASEDNVKALLNTAFDDEMRKWFEVIAAGDMVKNKKPAPDIYLLALEKLNLSAKECLAIEDSNQGLTAATEAGLTTVITVNQYTQQQRFDRAILVIDHLGESDQPFQVIMGNSYDEQYFNIALARHYLSS